MNGIAPARHVAAEPTTLPCDVFLQAPNEVAAPDFGLFRDTLNSHFYPARVEALDRDMDMHDPWLTAIHLTLTTIGYVRFGTTVSVDPGDLSAYHVNVVLSGTVDSRCGDQKAIASPRVAAVFSPDRHTQLPRWDADAAQLSIKFPRTRVEQELGALLGRQVVKPIEFRLALPVDGGAGRRWMSILSALLQSVDGLGTAAELRHLESLERSLISGLLISQVHSYTEDLATDPSRGAPQTAIDRVVEAIQRAPDRGYTLADLARFAGTSARSLQYGFQERYGTTPMRYLRQVRLDRARDDLAQDHGSVADVAYHWGFTNLGRFARAYRDRFGEFPGGTLSRSRTARLPASARPASRPGDGHGQGTRPQARMGS
jgi:AraC-like DNA-binding protein